ncbi:MAG: hypothetical protein M3Z22_07560 [Verrucomicrobiota bacterium]|nr:hypothetical protein [Verrucomicrobiota bacterium]
MKNHPIAANFASVRRTLRFLPTLALLLTASASSLFSASEEKRDLSDSPAQLWIENLPASTQLLKAPRPQSVPAFTPEVTAATWKSIGPVALNGQTSNRVDPVSGRATAWAIHPTNSDIVYLGTAQGGVWRSLNGGASWAQLMDSAFAPGAGTPLAIGSIAIDPTSSSTLFVGTGEGNLSGDSFFGSGFYIITNADTFNPVVNGPFNTADVGGDIFTGRSIVAIAIDPTNSNNVFVSTSSGIGGLRSAAFSVLPPRGVYRCTNAKAGINGGSGTPLWTRLQVTGTTTTNTISTSLVMEPGNPNVLVAAYLGQAAGDPAGIYRTANALATTPTWTLSKANPLGATTGNAKLAISKVGAAVTVYATTGEANGSLFKSTDGGTTFGPAIAAVTGFAGGQSFYDIAVAVDPTDPNNVSIGGNTSANIYKYSRDGGATFASSITGLHADVHAIAYAPSNPSIIYHANDGGVWRSIDAGLSWSSLNNGTLSTFQYSGIAVHPTDRNFTLAGTQDNGTHLRRTDGSWYRADFGDGGFSRIDQNATDTTTVTMYHTYFNQSANLIGTGRNLTVPCAVEGNWAFRGIFAGAADPTPVCDGSPGDLFNGIVLNDAVNFYAPMALGPGNPNVWYFGSDKLYRSPNRADTATAVSQTFQSSVPVSSIAISPQDDNVRVVGLNNGAVYATTTGAPASFFQIAGAGAANGTASTPAVPVDSIAIDPNNKNVAYLAFGGFGTSGTPIAHVWKTTNLNVLNAVPAGVVVFTPMSTGLPDLPGNAIAIDPQSGSASADSTDIYVGTDNGVFASTNNGASWNRYGTGFPRVSVFGLDIQNQARILRAATHGRGMYETFLAKQPAVPQLSQVVSRKTHGSAGTFDINMPLTGTTGVEDRVGTPAGSHTIVFTFTSNVTGGTASSSVGSVSGVSFDGADMIVQLNGIPDPQTVTVTANNVTNGTGTLPAVAVNVSFLQGDTNADRVVNTGDSIQVRNASGQIVDFTNFRRDVNTDGVINSGDSFIVRARAGNIVAAPEVPAEK